MTEVSKEYARAVFMLAVENDSVQSYLDGLLKIRDVISENPDYIRFLESPAISLRERLVAVGEAFSDSVPAQIVDFMQLLCTNGRIGLLNECIDDFCELERLASSRKVATVRYAYELSGAQKAALEEKLGSLYNCTVEAVYIEDKSLIGGLKVEIDGESLDGSLSKRLKRAEEVMYNE